MLVDEHDNAIGSADKLKAHEAPGLLHRAFSVLLFNAGGELLLQQRAFTKYHFPGLWTNTCCSHPRPGETVADAARRRLDEELGVHADIEPVGRFVYRAVDRQSGLVEHELDHVLVGRFDGSPCPAPSEVAGWQWVAVPHLRRCLDRDAARFTPWFPLVLDVVGAR
ncbi:MAG: isopentenyl-diphosphate Delta-isomerase [Acidimicrobiia bacterium]